MTRIQEKECAYHLSSTLTARGFLAAPAFLENPHATILIAPDWRGRSPFYLEIARALAELGYMAFTLDMYGDAKLGNTDEDKQSLYMPLKMNRPEIQKRMQCAMDFTLSIPGVNPNQVFAIGYCFGGMCVLDLARSGANVQKVVSLHGLLYPPPDTPPKNILSKILVLHAYEDHYVPSQQVIDFSEEMNGLGVDWQVHWYGKTQHSFTRPDANDAALGLHYSETAAKRAWQSMLNFFQEP